MKVRYIEHRPDEWLVGVAGLTPEQNGIYRTICDLIASTGGPIPAEDERLFAIIKANRNRINRVITELESIGKLVRTGPEVTQNGVRTGTKLTQNRVISELERARNRSIRGEDLARQRWNPKDLGDARRNARARKLKTINENENENEEEESDSPDGERQSAQQIAGAMIEVWNREVGPAGLRTVVKLTKARQGTCNARCKQDFASDLSQWRDFVRKVIASSFLLGDNQHGFKATFDWVLCPSNTAKILEGNYDDRSNGNDRKLSFYRGPTEPAPPLEGIEFPMGRPH